MFGHRNVSVLDGGLRKWLDDGFEVTEEEPQFEVFSVFLSKNKNGTPFTCLIGYQDPVLVPMINIFFPKIERNSQSRVNFSHIKMLIEKSKCSFAYL